MTHRVQDWMNFADIEEIQGRYWDIYVHPNAEGVMISLEEDEDVEVVVTNEYLRDLERHERTYIDEYLRVENQDYEDEDSEDEDSEDEDKSNLDFEEGNVGVEEL